MPPETILTAPNSPRQRAVVSTTPYAIAQRIAGIVILRNVVNADAPSVAAASSCSIPTSRSTGTTSRTTKGSEMKSIASSIDGYAKSTWIPCDVSQPPNQPSRAYKQVERQTDDDRRQRERQVDDRVDEPAARHPVAYDCDRACDAERRVERDRDERELERQLQRVHGDRVRDRGPERPEPVLERAPEDQRRRARRGSPRRSRAPRSGRGTYRSWRVYQRRMPPIASRTPSEITQQEQRRARRPPSGRRWRRAGRCRPTRPRS